MDTTTNIEKAAQALIRAEKQMKAATRRAAKQPTAPLYSLDIWTVDGELLTTTAEANLADARRHSRAAATTAPGGEACIWTADRKRLVEFATL